MHFTFFLLSLLLFSTALHAEQYQSKDDFLAEAFYQQPPKPKVLWLKADLKKDVADILQHKPGFLRTRFWQKDERTVWILEEIGKIKPITVGIIIDTDKITLVRVLAFRESRGWEVKHDFFTDQFKQLSLTPDLGLSKNIDGISGATLSVRALQKTARIALYFTQHIHAH